MKKLSRKDLTIVLGILVAAIILVVSVYFKDSALLNENISGNAILEKKIRPTVVMKKVLEKISSKVNL